MRLKMLVVLVFAQMIFERLSRSFYVVLSLEKSTTSRSHGQLYDNSKLMRTFGR